MSTVNSSYNRKPEEYNRKPEEFVKRANENRDNINNLQGEVKGLKSNNNELYKTIATNNANKHTIAALEARLKYLQGGVEHQTANFEEVEDNLQNQKRNNVVNLKRAEEELEDQKERERELELQKRAKKTQVKELAEKLAKLQDRVTKTTKLSNEKAIQRIALAEQVKEMASRILFEEKHYELMEKALEYGDYPDMDPFNDYENDNMEGLLNRYAEQFKKEYEKLIATQRQREVEALLYQLKKYNNEIEIKKNEIDHMNEQITEMKRGIAKQTIERNNIRSELEALRRQQLAKHKIAEARRSELEGEIRKLEKQNQVLTTSIDKTQERANEALLVIIQLEFEIKTYENLLDTQNNFDMSRGRHASNGSRSSGSSRGSGRASPLYATRKMDQQKTGDSRAGDFNSSSASLYSDV